MRRKRRRTERPEYRLSVASALCLVGLLCGGCGSREEPSVPAAALDKPTTGIEGTLSVEPVGAAAYAVVVDVSCRVTGREVTVRLLSPEGATVEDGGGVWRTVLKAKERKRFRAVVKCSPEGISSIRAEVVVSGGGFTLRRVLRPRGVVAVKRVRAVGGSWRHRALTRKEYESRRGGGR